MSQKIIQGQANEFDLFSYFQDSFSFFSYIPIRLFIIMYLLTCYIIINFGVWYNEFYKVKFGSSENLFVFLLIFFIYFFIIIKHYDFSFFLFIIKIIFLYFYDWIANFYISFYDYLFRSGLYSIDFIDDWIDKYNYYKKFKLYILEILDSIEQKYGSSWS